MKEAEKEVEKVTEEEKEIIKSAEDSDDEDDYYDEPIHPTVKEPEPIPVSAQKIGYNEAEVHIE